MGKKGKKAQTGKPKKLTAKEIGKRLDALVKKLEEELKGADLFSPMQPKEDCPICLVRLSFGIGDFSNTYHACCGKLICSGCFQENERIIENSGKGYLCPFCRAPNSATGADYIQKAESRARNNDARACQVVAESYLDGDYGLP